MSTFCPASARVPSIQKLLPAWSPVTAPVGTPRGCQSHTTVGLLMEPLVFKTTPTPIQSHLKSPVPGKDETLHSLLGTSTDVQAQWGRRTQSSKRGFGVQTALTSFCSAQTMQMIPERGDVDKLSPSELLVLTSSLSQPPWPLLETAAPGRDIPSVLSSHMGSSQQAAKAKLFHHLAHNLG